MMRSHSQTNLTIKLLARKRKYNNRDSSI